jgi:hypothetical protein
MAVPTAMLLLLQLDEPSIPDDQLGLISFCLFSPQIPLVSGKISFLDNFEASSMSTVQIVLET